MAQARGWTRTPDAAKVEDWTLEQYLELPVELGIIHAPTKTAGMQAKDFRNLIHPGRSKRLLIKCSRGIAYAALAAMDFVITEAS